MMRRDDEIVAVNIEAKLTHSKIVYAVAQVRGCLH